jgi:type II secretory pathway pseudopilin PulG
MRFWILDFGFRICREQVARDSRGFTLIEVIFIIVIVSIFISAIGVPLLTGIRDSDVPEKATVAYFLALEKVEELASISTASIGSADWTAVTGDGFTSYERKVDVCDVNCVSLTTADCAPSDPPSNPESGSGCRKVTVTVKHTPKLPNGVSVVTLRTAY